jgi:hypothetical protein
MTEIVCNEIEEVLNIGECAVELSPNIPIWSDKLSQVSTTVND